MGLLNGYFLYVYFELGYVKILFYFLFFVLINEFVGFSATVIQFFRVSGLCCAISDIIAISAA